MRRLLAIALAAVLSLTACSAAESAPAGTTAPATPAASVSSSVPAAASVPASASAAATATLPTLANTHGGWVSLDNGVPSPATLVGYDWVAPELFVMTTDSLPGAVSEDFSGLTPSQLYQQLRAGDPQRLVLPSISDWGLGQSDDTLDYWLGQLATPAGRAESVQAFVAIAERAKTDGADGLSINFESALETPSLRAAAKLRGNLTTFIAALHQELAQRGLLLALAVFSKTDDTPDTDYLLPYLYDYHALGQVVDLLEVMTYNEHETSSEAGSIASLAWVREVMNFALTQVPADKLSLGIANYGYGWAMRSGIENIEIPANTPVKGAKLAAGGEYQFTLVCQPSPEYPQTRKFTVVFSGQPAIRARVALAQELGVGSFVYALPGTTAADPCTA